MKLILFVDQQLTLFFKNLFPHNPFFDHIFSFFSLKGYSIVIWILIFILAIILEEKKNPDISKNDKKFLIIFFLSFFTTVFLVEFFLKNFFHRPRPIHQWQPDTINSRQIPSSPPCPVNFSFPSGHAATAFTAATVLSFFDKKRKWLYYLIAFTIAYSRIFLGCHYFSDVLVGGILGLVIAKLIIKISSFSTS